jgi:hypothetical protein
MRNYLTNASFLAADELKATEALENVRQSFHHDLPHGITGINYADITPGLGALTVNLGFAISDTANIETLEGDVHQQIIDVLAGAGIENPDVSTQEDYLFTPPSPTPLRPAAIKYVTAGPAWNE